MLHLLLLMTGTRGPFWVSQVDSPFLLVLIFEIEYLVTLGSFDFGGLGEVEVEFSHFYSSFNHTSSVEHGCRKIFSLAATPRHSSLVPQTWWW